MASGTAVRDHIQQILALKRLGSGGNKTQEYWAPRDASFDVYPGETVSASLEQMVPKVLSSITRPTEGYIDIFEVVESNVYAGDVLRRIACKARLGQFREKVLQSDRGSRVNETDQGYYVLTSGGEGALYPSGRCAIAAT